LLLFVIASEAKRSPAFPVILSEAKDLALSVIASAAKDLAFFRHRKRSEGSCVHVQDSSLRSE